MNQMKDLLERYWNCETSVEEEQLLREWFRREDIPEELVKYRSLFLLRNDVVEQKANPILAQNISDTISKGIRKSRIIDFYPVMKVAVSVLIVISLGIGIHTHYRQEKFLDEMFSETYTDPEDALKEIRVVLDKVSSSFSKAQEFLDESHYSSISIPDSVPEALEDTIN